MTSKEIKPENELAREYGLLIEEVKGIGAKFVQLSEKARKSGLKYYEIDFRRNANNFALEAKEMTGRKGNLEKGYHPDTETTTPPPIVRDLRKY